jgi:hypothetical protein
MKIIVLMLSLSLLLTFPYLTTQQDVNEELDES